MPTKAESLWDDCITALNTLLQHPCGSPGYKTASTRLSKAMKRLQEALGTAYKAAEWEKIVKQLEVRCWLSLASGVSHNARAHAGLSKTCGGHKRGVQGLSHHVPRGLPGGCDSQGRLSSALC